MYFIGELYDRFVGHQKATKESEVLTIIDHKPTDKAATAVASSALKRVQAEKQEMVAKEKLYLTANEIHKNSETIDHFLNIFSAIEANSEALNVNSTDGSQQLDKKSIQNLASKKSDSVAYLYNQFKPEEGNEDEAKTGPDSSSSILTIKQLRKEFPSQKRAAIDNFDDKLARLQAACFGFTARYGLFEKANDDFFNERHGQNLATYSMLDVYKDAVQFLKKITPQYHSREFYVEQTKANNSTAQDGLKTGTPTKAKKKIVTTSTAVSIENPSPLEQKMAPYFARFPQYAELRKLILFYKQDQKIMPHEEIPLVKTEEGAVPNLYVHPQTQARVELSLYDYHVIYKLLNETDLYGPLVSNLLASHREVIGLLGDDGKIKPAHLKNGADPLKKMEFRRDPWMAGFVTSVLRNHIPLNLFVLFPDLTKNLEKVYMGSRIGSFVGVGNFENNTPYDQCPVKLLGEEQIIRCRYGKPTTVQFRICGHWIDITTEESRNVNIHDIFNKTENRWDTTYAPNETFNGILKHYVENSLGWILYEPAYGHGIQKLHRHDHNFEQIPSEDRGPHDELPKAKRPAPSNKHKTAEAFDLDNYVFTREKGDSTDPTNRDHFTSQMTSLDDLEEQYPDYDLSGLRPDPSGKREVQYAAFWCSNRKEINLGGFATTHSFLKLIIPEENNPGICRVINLGYTPTEFIGTTAQRGIDCGSFTIPHPENKESTYGGIFNMAAQGFAALNIFGRSAKGTLGNDLDLVYSGRDKIGQGFVLGEDEFKKVCDVIQDQINKSRNEELSFNAIGMNCAHRLTKIMRKTVGADFNDSLRDLLIKARKEKLQNLTLIEKLCEFISEYIFWRNAEEREILFIQNIKYAIDTDDINALDDVLAELLPYLDVEDSKKLFDEAAKFLADVHLRNLKKFKDESSSTDAVNEFTNLLDDENKRANLKPYKQFTAEDDTAFFDTISTNMDTYKTIVGQQLTPKERKAEMAKLLKELVIQGLKAASPYATDFFDADFGGGEALIGPIRNIENKYLRRFIILMVIFLFLAPYRTRTVEKTNADGSTYTKTVSLWSKADPERFKIPPKIFETMRRNDEFAVQEAILCKKMALLQEAAEKTNELANTAITNAV